MKTSTWLRGTRFDIVLLSETDEREFESFFEGLTEADQKQVDAILERMADHGPILNVEKSRELEDGIYEFKTKNVRIFWFYDEGRIVLISHGKMKNALTKNSSYRPEVDRAKRLRARWRAQKEGE